MTSSRAPLAFAEWRPVTIRAFFPMIQLARLSFTQPVPKKTLVGIKKENIPCIGQPPLHSNQFPLAALEVPVHQKSPEEQINNHANPGSNEAHIQGYRQ